MLPTGRLYDFNVFLNRVPIKNTITELAIINNAPKWLTGVFVLSKS